MDGTCKPSAIFPMLCCWWRRPMWFRCGARAGCKPSYRKERDTIACEWCSTATRRFRFHRRRRRKGDQLQGAVEGAQQLPAHRTGHRQGSPVAEQGNNELGRSYQGLAAELAGATTSAEGNSRCSTSTTKATARNEPRATWWSRPCALDSRSRSTRQIWGNTFSHGPCFAGLLASAISPSLLES